MASFLPLLLILIFALLGWRFRSYRQMAIIVCLFLVLFIFPALTVQQLGGDAHVYAPTLRYFLESGHIRVSPITTPTLVLLILWAAPFNILMGFSVASMNDAVLVAAVGCLHIVYLFLTELGLRPRWAYFGVALLAFNPLFLSASYGFTTDVPFLVPFFGALYAFLRAFRNTQIRWQWLLIGGLCAACAYLVRQIGLVVSVVPCLYVFFMPTSSLVLRLYRSCLVAGLPLLIAALHQVWYHSVYPAQFVDGLANQTLFSLPLFLSVGVVFFRLVLALFYLGPFLLPALLLNIRRQLVGGLGVAAFIAALSYFGGVYIIHGVPLPNSLTANGWGIEGFGHREWLPTPLWWVLGALGFFGATLLLWQWAQGLQDFWQNGGVRQPRRLIFTRPLSPHIMVWGCALILLVPTLSWASYYDRYWLPFLPFLIFLVLKRAQENAVTRFRTIAKVCGSLLIAIGATTFSVVLYDTTAWNTAQWELGQRYLAEGYAIDDLQGGYQWQVTYIARWTDVALLRNDDEGKPRPPVVSYTPRYIFAWSIPAGVTPILQTQFPCYIPGAQARLYIIPIPETIQSP